MKKCVLIYDDDAEILFLCEKILEKQYRVKSLLKCQYIIEDITRIQPDIILMDLWIPTIGGEKAVQIMKNDPLIKLIPVILFSANAEINEICERIGADGFIAKPFDVNDFREIIKRNIL
ncbi:MAG: response regulator [Ginsengibacter sp.]|jgi:DNA-binding NtrC family response regulator